MDLNSKIAVLDQICRIYDEFVAKLDIASGALGALAVTGVFDVPKTAGVGEAIAAGAKVYWDVADGVAKTDDESGANKYLGKTVAAAGDDDVTVRVRLEQ